MKMNTPVNRHTTRGLPSCAVAGEPADESTYGAAPAQSGGGGTEYQSPTVKIRRTAAHSS